MCQSWADVAGQGRQHTCPGYDASMPCVALPCSSPTLPMVTSRNRTYADFLNWSRSILYNTPSLDTCGVFFYFVLLKYKEYTTQKAR